LEESRFSQSWSVTKSSLSIDNIEISDSEKFDIDLTIKCKHCGFEHTSNLHREDKQSMEKRLLIMKVAQTVDRFLHMMSSIMTKLYTIILVI
jgi:thymidine phosphorylase